MRAILVLVIISGCASGPQVRKTATCAEHRGQVAALVQPLLDGEWYPGVSVGLVSGNCVERYDFGVKAGSRYQIGSVTKVFTSLALAELVHRGAVELKEPIARLLDGVTVPSLDGRDITLVDLATHSSGLPRMPDNFSPSDPAQPYADYDSARLDAFLAGYHLTRAPGAHYEYSNLGAGLLGDALARSLKKSYAEMVHDLIAVPLGLAATSTEPDARVVDGHGADGAVVKGWRFDALAGAGALYSTVDDLLKLVGAELAPQTTPLADALAMTAAEHFSDGATHSGLAWVIGRRGVQTVRWHNGETGGYHGFVAFDRERQLAVVVLANGVGMKLDELGDALLTLAAGGHATLSLPPLVHVAPERLKALAGKYQLGPATLTLTADGDKLFAQLTGQPRLRIYPVDDTHFRWRVVDAELQVDGKTAILRQSGREIVWQRAQ